MKFKIGDKVKLKEDCSGSVTGVVYTLKDRFKNGEPINLCAWDMAIGNDCGCSCEKNFIRVSSKNMAKAKPIKYILIYDTNDRDPYEEFCTLDEVKKRIEELIADGEELIMSSVKVYEVKSAAKVETQIVFSKENNKSSK